MKNPTSVLLQKFYSDLSKGDFGAAFSACSDKMTFQVPGKSKVAGKFTKADFAQGYFSRLKELSGGTFQLDVHDILVSDVHATVLGTEKATRDGKTAEFRTVHVWRFEGGKPVAWYEYPRDLYAFDAFWS